MVSESAGLEPGLVEVFVLSLVLFVAEELVEVEMVFEVPVVSVVEVGWHV